MNRIPRHYLVACISVLFCILAIVYVQVMGRPKRPQEIPKHIRELQNAQTIAGAWASLEKHHLSKPATEPNNDPETTIAEKTKQEPMDASFSDSAPSNETSTNVASTLAQPMESSGKPYPTFRGDGNFDVPDTPENRQLMARHEEICRILNNDVFPLRNELMEVIEELMAEVSSGELTSEEYRRLDQEYTGYYRQLGEMMQSLLDEGSEITHQLVAS